MASDLSISVVLPVYHPQPSPTHIKWLKRALESILDQRMAVDHEILLVDDGSPVPVASSAESLGAAAREVGWIRVPSNRGLVNALNTGILAARHTLIARLDADDVWMPTKIDKQLSLFANDADLTIAATGMSMVSTEESLIAEHIRPGDWQGILRFFVEVGCPFPHGSVLAKKQIYRLLGGYPHNADFSHCEDYALWGCWLRFFKPAMVEEPLYGYTVSDTSVSAIHQDQQRDASGIVRQRFARGDLADRLPPALDGLAQCLGLSLIQAGTLAYLLWHFKPLVTLPRAALAPLRVILFDREFSVDSVEGPALHWTGLLGLPKPPEPLGDEIHGHFYVL
jgi:glycosyltransferase involved in cell wall biosynthesis